jgi:predicted transcriptional regulator
VPDGGRRGTTGEERKIQAQDRIRYWTRKRERARASKNRGEAEDCESKIRYWSMRLRGLAEVLEAASSELQTLLSSSEPESPE